MRGKFGTQASLVLLCAVPRAVREALTSWDRNLYGLPKALTETKSRIYEKIYHLGTELVTTCSIFSPSLCIRISHQEHGLDIQ